MINLNNMEERFMEIIALIFSGVSAAAAVVSAVAAFATKNKVNSLIKQINNIQQRKVKNKGDVDIANDGKNSGTIVGINTGDIK